MDSVYTSKEIYRLFGVSKQKLAYWRAKGLVRPSGPRRGRAFTYTFEDLLALKCILKMRDNGLSTYRIRRIVGQLRKEFPEARDPLLVTTPFSFREKRAFIEIEGTTYDAEERQGLLFRLDSVQAKVYELVPAKPSRERQLRLAAEALRERSQQE